MLRSPAFASRTASALNSGVNALLFLRPIPASWCLRGCPRKRGRTTRSAAEGGAGGAQARRTRGVDRTARPCPCGSGRKFERCCGT
ncbi:SEC-C metal-binding domain-containing protein [Sorangium sp. So ce590]|uniref:SEC-C metal-binding domain-containing protein n=1 Tax=Sorangium sp. So ce590 TaxID=3133317 RepID=UPI003F5E779E